MKKTSEDGKVEGITFTVAGNGINQTVTTNAAGEIQIDGLTPGVYTVTEQNYEKYEPQSVQRVTVIGGKTTTVTFNNVLKRGELTVTKTSEDSLVEGMKFHLYGTSLSGIAVDEYAVTDSSGKAYFKNVLIGSGYVLEEVDTPVRYVVPDSQTASVEWNSVTEKSVANVLKKWNATVTKSDREAVRHRVSPLPEQFMAFIKANSSSTLIRLMQMVSLSQPIMSAAMTGTSLKSVHPKAICWMKPPIMLAQKLSFIPWNTTPPPTM